MKKILQYIFLLLLNSIYAQVGINTQKVDESSILQVNSQNKGILIPRIQLISLNDKAPLQGELAEGTLIFNKSIANTSTNKVFQGFYYWKNSHWNTLASNVLEEEYQVVQYKNTPTSTLNFNDTTTGIGKEIDIFGIENFNDDKSIYNKLNNTSLQFEKDGLYLVTLNLALEDQSSNNELYGNYSNVEVYMGFTLSNSLSENFIAERILTVVPQFRGTGSEFISVNTPNNIIQSTTSSTKRLYTRGKFSYTLSTYINAKKGEILKLRAIQNNTSTRGKGIVTYDPESISTITIIKLK